MSARGHPSGGALRSRSGHPAAVSLRLPRGALDAAFERTVAFALPPLGNCTELLRAGGREPGAGLWTPVGGPRSRVADSLSCRLPET